MRCGQAILRMGLVSLALSVAAWAQSRPADTQPTTATAATTRPAVPDVPITFGRSGRKVLVWLTAPKDALVEKVVLRAFGRAWTAPVAARPMGARPGYTAEVDIPAVRVPTVFSVTPADSPNIELGQLVAYPDRDVEWDKKITLYSCGAPAWFDQWAAATGLPVKQVAGADMASAKVAPADEKGKSLLILGQTAAGRDLADVAKLAKDKKVNVLVLDADWFGGAAGPVSAAPAQMLGGLAQIAKQVWPQPLRFASHRKPWSGIANRWAWIVDEAGLPLMEQISMPTSDFRDHSGVLLSYLPWVGILGRAETADLAFLDMVGMASGMELHRLMTSIGVIYPEMDEVAAKKRPVLAQAHQPLEYVPEHLLVLDMRGDGTPTTEQLKERGSWEHAPLLILGDDKLLDEWEWLKLDRTKKIINRPGVVWLSDDELPPSKDNQIRLMLKLTALGVPLAPPNSEEKKQ